MGLMPRVLPLFFLHLLQLRDGKMLNWNNVLCADEIGQKLVVRVDKIIGQGAIEFESNLSGGRAIREFDHPAQ